MSSKNRVNNTAVSVLIVINSFLSAVAHRIANPVAHEETFASGVEQRQRKFHSAFYFFRCHFTDISRFSRRPAGSDEFPEASTRAQREIARLRNLVAVLAVRAGVDPEDPSIQLAASSLSPFATTPYPQSLPSTPSASSVSSSSSDFGPMSVENSSNEDSDAEVPAVPDVPEIAVSRSASMPMIEEIKKISITTDTTKMVVPGDVTFESPHSVTPTSFRFSYRDQSTGWYEQSADARVLWPGASFSSPHTEGPPAHIWD